MNTSNENSTGFSGLGPAMASQDKNQKQERCTNPLQDEISSINLMIDAFLNPCVTLEKEKVENIMEELAKIIHSQFLMDVHNLYGEEIFQSLETSIETSFESYSETVARLVPNHQEIFDASRPKVINEEKFCILMQKIDDMEE